MTLVITEISDFGIAMAADSALTKRIVLPSGVIMSQVLTGTQKLQYIPQLKAGISMWGFGSVRTGNGFIPTDAWIIDFISRYDDIDTLERFAVALASELQLAVGEIQQPMGFHLAGYVDENGEKLPTIYHVRNCDGPIDGQYVIHEFIPGLQFAPQRPPVDDYYVLRNGDFGPYALLSAVVLRILPAIQQVNDITIPHPSLRGRISFHGAWINFISDLYASAGRNRTIGGKVSAMGMTPEGDVIYLSE